jgi:G3E family GTPase
MDPRTPVTLITGSLGSGKTTLLRRILDAGGLRLAILMNEFGEIAIDSAIIRGESVDIVELAGGCVCCSMTGELEAAIREILDKFQPELIVVEATGVAESDALVYEVEDSLPEVRLDSVVCIVDAYASIKHPYVGYTSRTQIASADLILINKVDLVTTEELKEVTAQVRHHNDRAEVFNTVGCDVDPGVLFGLDAQDRPKTEGRHGGVEFQSFSYATDALISEDRFLRVVEQLPESVFRAKGFVRFSDKTCLFNYVAGRTDFEEFPADSVRMVFIGPGLARDRDEIVAMLEGCEVR